MTDPANGWGSTLYNAFQGTVNAVACHVGYYAGTGYAAVHTPQIAGYLAAKKCGDGILNWYARHTFSNAITPYVVMSGGVAGAAAASVATAIAIKALDVSARAIYHAVSPLCGRVTKLQE